MKLKRFKDVNEYTSYDDMFDPPNREESEEYDSVDFFKENIRENGLSYILMDSQKDGKTSYNFEDSKLTSLCNQYIEVVMKLEQKLDIGEL